MSLPIDSGYFPSTELSNLTQRAKAEPEIRQNRIRDVAQKLAQGSLFDSAGRFPDRQRNPRSRRRRRRRMSLRSDRAFRDDPAHRFLPHDPIRFRTFPIFPDRSASRSPAHASMMPGSPRGSPREERRIVASRRRRRLVRADGSDPSRLRSLLPVGGDPRRSEATVNLAIGPPSSARRVRDGHRGR